MTGPPAPTRWRIRVRGAMTPAVAKALEGIVITDVGISTAMEGETQNAAQLAALVTRLQAYGLEILDVHRCEPS